MVTDRYTHTHKPMPVKTYSRAFAGRNMNLCENYNHEGAL